MARQSVKPFEWIVMDDGAEPVKCIMGQRHVFCPELRGKTSLLLKLKTVLAAQLVKGDALVFWEDDDRYAPAWLAWCAEKLRDFTLVGEGKAIYYNVAGRWWYEHSNLMHASLCSTALRASLFPVLQQVCNMSSNSFVDEALWLETTTPKLLIDPLQSGGKRMVVGMKAMPGRVGYGGGHRAKPPDARPDPNLDKLRDLIGADADLYAPFKRDIVFPPEPVPSGVRGDGRVYQGPRGGNEPARKQADWAVWLAGLKGKPNVLGLEISDGTGDTRAWMMANIFTHPSSGYVVAEDWGDAEGERQYDLVYVAGSREAPDVLRNAVNAFDAVKVGGCIIFSDYIWDGNNDALLCPKIAVDAFLNLYSRKVYLFGKGAQVMIRKLTE
jgi:hypothetical protein